MGVLRWQSVADFSVLAVAIYLLLRWGREARALRLALSILGLRLGALVARQLGLLITGWILDTATLVALVALVVVFQPELRRLLMRIDPWHHARREPGLSAAAAVSAAAWCLARNRCGALIVIVRKDLIDELVTTGVRLRGIVSAEILEAVFQKGSAVHDGAAVIEGGLISRVGVVLPLTQRGNVPEHYGTRHRAAMGLAERSDALVVAVSEERGEVTLVHGGQLRLMADETDLAAALDDLAARPDDGSEGGRWPLRPAEFKLQAAALILSALVWTLTFLFPGSSVRVRAVPVEFTHVPPGLTVVSQSQETVNVWLRGSDFIFDSVNLEALAAACDLSAARAGQNDVPLHTDALELPFGLKVEAIAPRQINVRLAANTPPTPAR
ncbi:MAG: diadenylate cyclase [Acidobacteriota bacterium]